MDSSSRYASVETVNDPRLEVIPGSANQPPPLVGYNAWSGDEILVEAVKREGGDWISERASRMGDLVGSERMQTLATQANRYAPELRTHDRFGDRIDAVEYHPAYHELMALACRRRPQSLFHRASEGQVRQPLQRFVRNRVSRHPCAHCRRGRARHRHADRDGSPHALRH